MWLTRPTPEVPSDAGWSPERGFFSELIYRSLLEWPPSWPSAKASASRAAVVGLIPSFDVDLFPG